MSTPLRKEVSIVKFVEGRKISILKSKYEFVTSHTARRSFATNEYLAIDLQQGEIRAITGHKTDMHNPIKLTHSFRSKLTYLFTGEDFTVGYYYSNAVAA